MTQDDQIDQLLRTVAPPAPGSYLYGAVMTAIDEDQSGVTLRNVVRILWPFGPAWQPLTALVIVAAMGVGADITLLNQNEDAVEFAAQDFGTIVLGDLSGLGQDLGVFDE